MGWLDNSTNNIILDAVLTDYGRQALARNNGSFQISKFAFGDDEVNYGIIKKYGRTVGKEKIEKNTPVFEALTNQNLALKNRMMSIPLPLVYLPKLSLEGSISVLELDIGTNKEKDVTVKLLLSDKDSSTSISPQLADASFDIYIPTLFMTINNLNLAAEVRGLDAVRTAIVNLPTQVANSTKNEKKVLFKVNVKSITDTTFDTFGRFVSGYKTISTFIRVVGTSSGQTLDIPVTITQKAQ